MAYEQTAADLERHLAEQIGFIQSSCRGYDEGTEAEAKRLASAIRTLCHATKMSAPIRLQIPAMAAWRWFDSAGELNPHNLISEWPMLCAVMTAGPSPTWRWVPQCTGGSDVRPVPEGLRPPNQLIRFSDWWNEPVARGAEEGKRTRTISRRLLVLSLANKEGGSHVDPKISDNPYLDLSRRNLLGWVLHDEHGREVEPANNPSLPMMRQVGHEVIKTVELYRPDLLGEQ